jgi:hypothetical protein
MAPLALDLLDQRIRSTAIQAPTAPSATTGNQALAGRGGGRGFGRGVGMRGRFQARSAAWGVPAMAPRVSREQETSWLKAQATDLQEALKQIGERLQNLEQE